MPKFLEEKLKEEYGDNPHADEELDVKALEILTEMAKPDPNERSIAFCPVCGESWGMTLDCGSCIAIRGAMRNV